MYVFTVSSQPRKWRKTLSSAVDVYGSLIGMEKDLRVQALKLTPVEQLADNCPRCFGPTVAGKMADEPDIVVSLDGNFQHQRHLASSTEQPSSSLKYPPNFIVPEELAVWKAHLEDLRSSGTGRAPASVGNRVTRDEFIVSNIPSIL